MRPEDLFGGIDFDNLFGGLGFDFGGGIFDRFFSARRRSAGLQRGENLEALLRVPLERVVSGVEEGMVLRVRVLVPQRLSAAERQIYEQLRELQD